MKRRFADLRKSDFPVLFSGNGMVIVLGGKGMLRSHMPVLASMGYVKDSEVEVNPRPTKKTKGRKGNRRPGS